MEFVNGSEDVDWSHLAQNRVQWRVHVNIYIKAREFPWPAELLLTSQKDCAPWSKTSRS